MPKIASSTFSQKNGGMLEPRVQRGGRVPHRKSPFWWDISKVTSPENAYLEDLKGAGAGEDPRRWQPGTLRQYRCSQH